MQCNKFTEQFITYIQDLMANIKKQEECCKISKILKTCRAKSPYENILPKNL